MRMIPNQPLNTSSYAELRLFDKLRSLEMKQDGHEWFAMHSLNLPRHEYKRFGEIDFVICGPGGLFVIEVKGGRVSCQDGIWETTNRYNATERLRESPFKQAEGALHGLLKKLPANLSNAFVVGYGVVMPDVELLPASAEWDRAVLADGRDFKQFERWFERFIKHWRDKDMRKTSSTSWQLKELMQFLRPDFEAVIPLHIAAHDVETRIASLTEDQLRLIDVMDVNPRIICYGGAGTGKTMMAIDLAKRWGAEGLKTALACHSPWLKSFLEQFSMPGLVISLAKSIHTAARRSGVEKFDALIVDEGQDILNMEALDKLDSYLQGGLSNGRWCFFHDSNNQSGLCGSYVPDAYEYLKSISPVQIPLNTNCRNSLPILEQIQNDLGADMGNSGVGDGPEVRKILVQDNDSGIQALKKELTTLIDDEGFNPGDITVLSPLPFSQSWASPLSKNMRISFTVLDSASQRNLNHNTVGFAKVEDFKGLESEVIILIDMPELGHNEAMRPFYYVGMSRARALLSMICY